MDSFEVRVPFKGEAVSVFKTVSDLFSYVDFGKEKFTRVSDDTTSFCFPVTLGAFRLLLDGECDLVDQDFDNQVSLFSITSKDRGGKGKLDAKVRLSLDEVLNSSMVVCECDVTAKGMLARVALPLKETMSDKIERVLNSIIDESQKSIVIDDFSNDDLALVSPSNLVDPMVSNVKVEKSLVAAMVESGNLRTEIRSRPLWLVILQFPASVVSFPFDFLKRIFGVSSA